MAGPTIRSVRAVLPVLAAALVYWSILVAIVFAAFGPTDLVHRGTAAGLAFLGLPIALWVSSSIRREATLAAAELAYRDDLTGLPNRRAFMANMEAALGAKQSGATGIILYDVDGLKCVNDECGHQAGDELIRRVAATLQRPTGRHTSVYRIGGDEFAVVVDRLAGGSMTAVLRSVQPFVASFRTCEHEHEVAMSCGYASSLEGDTLAGLFHRADSKLRESKEVLYASGSLPDRRVLHRAPLAANGASAPGGLRIVRDGPYGQPG